MTESDWRDRFDSRLLAMELRLNDAEKRDAIGEVHHQNVENRLSGIEDTLKWLVRLIIGALIVAIVGFVISGGLDVSP